MDAYIALIAMIISILFTIGGVVSTILANEKTGRIAGMVVSSIFGILTICCYIRRKERKNDIELLSRGQGLLEIEEKKNRAKIIFNIIGDVLLFLVLTTLIVLLNVVFIIIKQNLIIVLIVSLLVWAGCSFVLIKDIINKINDRYKW